MKFTTAEGANPIDQGRHIGRAIDRIDGALKTCGVATYAYEHALPERPAYGYVVGSSIAKGRIKKMLVEEARSSSGVLAVLSADNVGLLGKGKMNVASLLAGPEVHHYHQAVALIVADSFEEARAAALMVHIDYENDDGAFDLDEAMADAVEPDSSGAKDQRVGHFDQAFDHADVSLDAWYQTPDQSHAMMEPHATTAAWDGDSLTIWTSSQMIDWWRSDLAETLKMPKEKIRVVSPFIGGGFGGKLFLRTDALLAALGAREVQRPVKVALHRPLIFNNTTHRPATRQRIRIGTDLLGRIQAVAHESWSGNLKGGDPETAVQQTQLLYSGQHRKTALRVAQLDLPEGNAMRAPGEAPGLMALEVAIDEVAEKLNMDPVEFRVLNDTQVDPAQPHRHFSQRQLVDCLRLGADRFGWSKRMNPASRRIGDWWIGLGVAAAFRNNLVQRSGARVRLGADGRVTVETDMTDIGTGSYTIIAQTAAEMLGLPISKVTVRLGDSSYPVSAGSGGQWGGNSATAGVYAACVRLREQIARQLDMPVSEANFSDGLVHVQGRSEPLSLALGTAQEMVAEDYMEYGDLDKQYQQSTFGAHFVEVGVDVYTGEIRVRRMLAVCAAGRILNPKTARSQVIGAMTMGVGAALMEELIVDKRLGCFINHDLAGYEVPVHADIPHQEVIFLTEADPVSSPMKAKGVGELGLCGVAAAIANAVYNATGVRVRDYPITLDKLLDELPKVR